MKRRFISHKEKKLLERLKNIKHTSVCVIFFVFIAAMGVLFYTMPDKPTVSEREKRELAKLPEFSFSALLDGSYTSEYSVYFADNFPFREQLIEVAQAVRSFMGSSNSDDVQIVEVTNNDNTQYEEFDEVPVSGADLPVLSFSDAQEQEAQIFAGNAFIIGNAVLTTNHQYTDLNDQYALAVNLFAKAYPEVDVHCIVIPTASEFYLPEKYRIEATEQKPMIEYVYGKLDENVNSIDIYPLLYQHKDEYIYFRTDHHWTGLGAYYAYCAFAKDRGFEPMDISKLEKVVYENYLGTLYDMVGGNDAMRKEPDTVIAYDIDACYELSVEYGSQSSPQTGPLIFKDLDVANKYMVFTKGDWPYIKISTGNETGRKIMVFKDSFGNAFVPFLVENYDEIYVLDPRRSLPSVKALIEGNGITDVLFLTNVVNTNVGQRVNEYLRLSYI